LAYDAVNGETDDELMMAIQIELDQIVTKEVCDVVYESASQEVGVGVVVGLGVGVGVVVGFGVGVAVGVGVGVAVGFGVEVGVGEGDAVGFGDAVGDGDGVACTNWIDPSWS